MGTLAMDACGDPAGFRMEGLVIKMLHDHFAGALPVAVTGNSPQQAIKGTLGVDLPERPSGSATWPLDVFAALSGDRKKLAISVVKPTQISQQCDLNVTGVQTTGTARLWQLTSSAGAIAPAPSPARGPFAGPPATMTAEALPQAPGAISLPPASITVYELGVR